MIDKSPALSKSNYKKILSSLVQAIIIGLLIWYFYENRETFNSLKNLHWQQILLIILLDTATFLVGGFLNYSMIRQLKTRVSFLDCVLLQYVNNLLNKILPTIGGGAAFRAIYLKQKYQLSYSQFTSTVAGLYVMSFFSTSLIALICLSIIYFQIGVVNWVLSLAFLGIFVVTLSIILFSSQIPQSDHRLFSILRKVIEGWNIIKKDRRFIIIYTCLSLLFLFLSALPNYIIYSALGNKTELVPMLFLSTLGIIMAFLNFTPDGIGIKEGIYIFSTSLVQIPGGILVLGSLILRAISICSTFIIGGICYWILSRQLSLIEKNNAPII